MQKGTMTYPWSIPPGCFPLQILLQQLEQEAGKPDKYDEDDGVDYDDQFPVQLVNRWVDLNDVVDEEACDAEHYQADNRDLSILVMLSDPVCFFTALECVCFSHRERHIMNDWNIRQCRNQKHVRRERRKEQVCRILVASPDVKEQDYVP